MKKKFIIFTLCFTLIFSSLNYKKTYADGGVISLPILGTVSALAVGTGIIINNSDDLYDLGRMFYDYVDRHNDLTWDTLQAIFASSVALTPSKLVSVKSDFLDIVKGFFDNTFSNNSDIIYSDTFCLPYYPNYYYPFDLIPGTTHTLSFDDYRVEIDIPTDVNSNGYYQISIRHGYFNPAYSDSSVRIVNYDINNIGLRLCVRRNGFKDLVHLYFYDKVSGSDVVGSPISNLLSSSSITFPYSGGYIWDNVENKKENDKSVSLPIPGNLGQLVGQGSTDFWDNTDGLVGQGGLTLPGVDSPSIGVDSSVNTFPSVDSDVPDVPGVESPSVPNEGIWSTIKDFVISLVVPSDSFWTDTWGGLYNNFIDSFPIVDMSGFDDLVTGEKKFPNIDINVMGVTGRVVNGDIINSIVDWLRPIIAGFMMICLMLFNYRKIYKLIRNSEPFGGVSSGTSDFKTGISEYSHIGLVNDGFKRSEDEEFARSRYYEEMYFKNGGKF